MRISVTFAGSWKLAALAAGARALGEFGAVALVVTQLLLRWEPET